MLRTCYLCDPEKVNDSDPQACASCRQAAVKTLESNLVDLGKIEEQTREKLRVIISKLRKARSDLNRLK